MEMENEGDIVQLTALRIGDEEYVVDIYRVKEIIRTLPITPVRRGPRFVEGVVNLRGTVVPIIDMRKRFGLPIEEGAPRKVVIMIIEGRLVGLIVDRVTEVIRVPRSAIQPAPGLFDQDNAPFFLGVCPYQDRELILLNVKNIISSDEAIEPPSPEEVMGTDPAP